MVQMTLRISEELVERLRPIGPWLPAVLELSLAGFRITVVKQWPNNAIV